MYSLLPAGAPSLDITSTSSACNANNLHMYSAGLARVALQEMNCIRRSDKHQRSVFKNRSRKKTNFRGQRIPFEIAAEYRPRGCRHQLVSFVMALATQVHMLFTSQRGQYSNGARRLRRSKCSTINPPSWDLLTKSLTFNRFKKLHKFLSNIQTFDRLALPSPVILVREDRSMQGILQNIVTQSFGLLKIIISTYQIGQNYRCCCSNL